MYIKKSVISGVVVFVGMVILLAVAIIYGFTEIQISKLACALVWGGCIFSVMTILDKIEGHKE